MTALHRLYDVLFMTLGALVVLWGALEVGWYVLYRILQGWQVADLFMKFCREQLRQKRRQRAGVE